MATEKRHKLPTASTSKESSLIIQLPTTSANNQSISLIDQNNNNNNNNNNGRLSFGASQDLEQNNMFNHCLRGHNRPTSDSQDQITQGGGSLLSGANTQQQQQQRRQLQLQHYRNHLNNFHNHVHQGRHLSQRQQSSERLTAQPTSTETAESEQQESITPPPHYHEIPGVVPAYQGRSSGPPPAYDDVVNPNAPPPSYQSLFGQVREARKTSNGLVDLFRQLFLVLIGTIGCTMIIGFLLLIPITMILVGVVYVNDCRAENIPSFLVVGGLVWIVKNILNCYNQFKKDASSSNRPPPRRQPIAAAHSSNSQRQSTETGSHGSSPASVLIVSPPQDLSVPTSESQRGDNPEAPNGSNDSQRLQQQQQQPTLNQQTVTTTSTTVRRSNPANRGQQHANHIRHPPMVGLTSFKCESILNYFLIVWFLAGCIVVYRIYEPDYENPASANYCNRLVYLYAFWLMTSAFIVMAIILSCLCCLMASSLMSCTHGR